MSREDLAKLVLVGELLVMFALAGDVGVDAVDARLADSEGGVAVLPMEISEIGSEGLKPFGGASLELLDDVREGIVLGEGEENVDVIFYGADDSRRALAIIKNSGQIRMQVRADVVVQHRRAMFGAEDQVNPIRDEGLGHVAPFQGFGGVRAVRRPRALPFVPRALPWASL
jgi:hypothetical protein